MTFMHATQGHKMLHYSDGHFVGKLASAMQYVYVCGGGCMVWMSNHHMP